MKVRTWKINICILPVLTYPVTASVFVFLTKILHLKKKNEIFSMANGILNIDPSYINLYTDSSEKLSPVILLYESSSLTG